MSIESAREFIKKLNNEPDLFQQSAAFKTKKERQQWAKGLGYDFSSEELELAVRELTDDDLEMVAGGRCCGKTCERDYRPSCPHDESCRCGHKQGAPPN